MRLRSTQLFWLLLVMVVSLFLFLAAPVLAVNSISNIHFSPVTGNSYHVGTGVILLVMFDLNCDSPGVLQVLPTSGSGIDLTPKWEYIRGYDQSRAWSDRSHDPP